LSKETHEVIDWDRHVKMTEKQKKAVDKVAAIKAKKAAQLAEEI
jgi:hypothetical protein